MKFLIYIMILSSVPLFSRNHFISPLKIYTPQKPVENHNAFKIRKSINKPADKFLNSVLNKQKNIKTIIIKARIDIRKRSLRIKGNMNIYMISPDKILIKTFVLGFNVSTLLINGNKLYFKDNIKNTLKIRKATPRNIARYIPIRLSLKQFKQMIKGAPPVIDYNNIELSNNKTELTLKNHREVQYLKFNSKGEILKMTLFQNREKRITINFSAIKYKNGYSYASRILFRDYKKSVKSRMTIISIEFNKKLNNNMFNPLKTK